MKNQMKFFAFFVMVMSLASLAIITDFILSKMRFWLLPKGVNPQRFPER